MNTIVIEFPVSFTGSKVVVIKALRAMFGYGLKEAKDLCEMHSERHVLELRDPSVSSAVIDEQCRLLRTEGCRVGSPVHVVLQSMRDLAAEALRLGEDDLANEILQLVLLEKLRRVGHFG
jgi:hypothetical protein